MKRRIKALLSVLMTAALTLGMLGWLTGLTQRKDSNFQYGPFLQQKADFDVLFFGTSHMVYGVYPMELWEDYGIVSYNLAGHGIHIPTVYWVMKNALCQSRPRLVVWWTATCWRSRRRCSITSPRCTSPWTCSP